EEFQRRLPLPGEVTAWFRRWPNANIGIVTGKISGLAVVDIDPRHGGSEALAALEDECAPLPSTVEVRTGGGGRHLYFASSGESLRSRVALTPGVDLRAECGLVVAPPSIHAYAWIEGGATTRPPSARRSTPGVRATRLRSDSPE